MRQFSISPFEMGHSCWRNRHLLRTLIQRDVVGRYRGSLMGILWSFFHPLLMLAIYTLVFSVVFKARWGSGNESRSEFALILFAGLLVFNLFAECVVRAPGLILSNANYVKKVIFPLEILPLVALGSAFFHMLIGIFVWLTFYVAFVGIPPKTLWLLPLVVIPPLLLTIGVSWLLASLGVYLRDVTHVAGVATTAMMFLCPIFYPTSSLPPEYQILLNLNPLTPAINHFRQILVWGLVPDLPGFGLYMLVSVIVAWLGFAWFQATRKGFADVV